MSNSNQHQPQPNWPAHRPPTTEAHTQLFDWDTNIQDANELPVRDPEFGLTYLRRREENERQHGIHQFLRFANQAAPLNSTLNANSEYPAGSGLGQGVWPQIPPELFFADATLDPDAEHGEQYPSDNIHGDDWPGAAGGELLDPSWGWGGDRMDEDVEEEEEPDEFEIGGWEEGDDDEEDGLREALMELARATERNGNAYDDRWRASHLDSDSLPRQIGAVELANQNAAAAERNLRRTYGLDNTQDPWAVNYYDYLGSRPLNPPAGAQEGHRAGPSVTRPSMFDLLEDRAKTKRRPSDPCSATSWTSFLAPGMVLAGSQVFVATPLVDSGLSGSTRMNRSQAQSGAEIHATSDYAARTSALRTAYAPPPPPPQLRPPSAGVPLVPPAPGTAAPEARSGEPESSTPTIARLREFGRRPPAFESLLAVLREDVRDPARPERFSDFASRVNLDVAALASAAMEEHRAGRHEKWAVEVTVLSYDPKARTIRGLMHALGFAGQAEPPTITTHLEGEILSPGTDGLWTPASARALPLTDWGVKRAAQAGRHWASIGPFKDVGREELTRLAADLKWLRRKTEGWVLMRWKETGFVNVAPDDSDLSIAGFYHCALDRRTGAIDGLYFDPVALPFQTLTLTPKRGSGVAYSHETFAFR